MRSLAVGWVEERNPTSTTLLPYRNANLINGFVGLRVAKPNLRFAFIRYRCGVETEYCHPNPNQWDNIRPEHSGENSNRDNPSELLPIHD